MKKQTIGSDLRASKRYHNEANPNYGHDVNPFDAVGIMKQKTDKRHIPYILDKQWKLKQFIRLCFQGL